MLPLSTLPQVLYVRNADVEFGTKLQEGMSVRFQLYTDNRGVGGCDVQAM